MSERALEFVEQWVSDHIGPADDPAQASALATQCLLAASAQGVPQTEVREAFDNLADFIAGEIAEAKERAGQAPTSEEAIAEEVEREAEDLEEDQEAGDSQSGPGGSSRT